MMDTTEALRVVRRQADALARRGFDDAPAVHDAADALAGAIALLAEAERFARKMVRDPDALVKMHGADLLQILEGDS